MDKLQSYVASVLIQNGQNELKSILNNNELHDNLLSTKYIHVF